MGNEPRLPSWLLRAGGAGAACAHFVCFAVAIPWWRLSSALAGGRGNEIAVAYLIAFSSMSWGSLATIAFSVELSRRLGLETPSVELDVGEAVATSRVAPAFLLRLRRRRVEEDALEESVTRLVAEKGTAADKVRRAIARMLSSFAIGVCVMAGLMA